MFGMRSRIEELLEAGWSRQAIARELGIDPSTVTREARILGFPDVVHRSSPFDWEAIQRYYDEGHTIDECKAKFGFSYGAWDKAAVRGEIRSRPRSERQLSHATRDRVEQLIARGYTQNQIAAELDISKSTVAYHCRRSGLRADPRFARRYDWSEVQRAIDAGGTLPERLHPAVWILRRDLGPSGPTRGRTPKTSCDANRRTARQLGGRGNEGTSNVAFWRPA